MRTTRDNLQLLKDSIKKRMEEKPEITNEVYQKNQIDTVNLLSLSIEVLIADLAEELGDLSVLDVLSALEKSREFQLHQMLNVNV